MKKVITLTAIMTLLLLTPHTAYAKGGSGSSHGGGSDFEEQRIKIENEIEDGVERLEFDIRGTVDSTSDSSFMIVGQTVVIDPSMVSDFRQRAEVTVGSMLRVRGVIMDGTFFVERIESR